MEMADIAQIISEQLTLSIDLVNCRAVSKCWLSGTSIVIDKRRKMGKLTLTLPQYIIGNIISSKPSCGTIFIKAKHGFGKVALTLAIADGITVLYTGKLMMKTYIKFFKEYGFSDRVYQVGQKNTNTDTPVNPLPILLCMYKDSHRIPSLLETLHKHCSTKVTEIIRETGVGSFKPQNIRYDKRIRIVDCLPHHKNLNEMYIDVPRHQSFLLYPVAQWIIIKYAESYTHHLGSIFASHKRTAVFGASQNDTNYKGINFAANLTTLNSAKRKTAVACIQGRYGRDSALKPELLLFELRNVDCVVLVVDKTWSLIEIMSYAHHYGNTQTFDLYVLTQDDCYASCELARIKSYRPWTSMLSCGTLDNLLLERDIEDAIRVSDQYMDIVDKCVVSLNPRYVNALCIAPDVVKWWNKHRSVNSALTVTAVCELFTKHRELVNNSECSYCGCIKQDN